MAATATITDKPMTDEEATPLHWLVLECLEAMIFETEKIPE